MRIYATIAGFNAANGARASEQGLFVSSESDWNVDAGGQGHPGGGRGNPGWILTHLYAENDISGTKPSWLVAYETKNGKTGRIALIREDWNHTLNDEWREKVLAGNTWLRALLNKPKMVLDIDMVDVVLPGAILS